jgi:release factor glutamine methyltransferase
MHICQGKVTIKQGSWFEPLRDDVGKFAGLVSNPPYIPSENISGLQAEVGKHEPRLALDGGADGLNDLLHLCNGAASMLKSGGIFVFEVPVLILQESKSMISSRNFYRSNPAKFLII